MQQSVGYFSVCVFLIKVYCGNPLQIKLMLSKETYWSRKVTVRNTVEIFELMIFIQCKVDKNLFLRNIYKFEIFTQILIKFQIFKTVAYNKQLIFILKYLISSKLTRFPLQYVYNYLIIHKKMLENSLNLPGKKRKGILLKRINYIALNFTYVISYDIW